MAAMMKSVQSMATATPRRSSVVVRASAEKQVDRRALFGVLAGAIGVALVAPQQSVAMTQASQAFTGGMLSGGGSMPKSSTAASMEGYTLEGTKKPSFVSPKKKKALLAKVRANAEKISS